MKTAYRVETERIVRELFEALPKRKPIVDVGGGGYKDWMEEVLEQRVITWDQFPGPDVDQVVDICERPWRLKNIAGTIVCSSVFEHVQLPWVAADNLVMSLQVGGGILVTAPFVYKVHETPKDYWRFLPSGLRTLFSGLKHVSSGTYVAGDDIGSYFAAVREK